MTRKSSIEWSRDRTETREVWQAQVSGDILTIVRHQRGDVQWFAKHGTYSQWADTVKEAKAQAEAFAGEDAFRFEIGEQVRIKTERSLDGQTPEHWDGALAEVLDRRCTAFTRLRVYRVGHLENGKTCEFREDEII